jgi:hypothetical protein
MAGVTPIADVPDAPTIGAATNVELLVLTITDQQLSPIQQGYWWNTYYIYCYIYTRLIYWHRHISYYSHRITVCYLLHLYSKCC